MKDSLWKLLMTAESGSGENFPAVLLVMAVSVLLGIAISFFERKGKRAWLLVLLEALLVTASVLVLMVLHAGLSELLLHLLLLLLVRVSFAYAERGHER